MAQAPKRPPSQNRLAVSGAEMMLLILLVIGLWVWVERAYTRFFGKPDDRPFLQKVNLKQEELKSLEALRTDAANQLLAAELDQLKQRASMKSLETLHPGIDKVQQGASTSIPGEAGKSYEAARTQERAAGELIKLLNARIESSRTEAEKITQQLQSATEEFQRARTEYLLKESAILFLLPLVIIVLPLLIVRALVNRATSGQVSTSQGSILFSLVVFALLILFTYQAFQLRAAVLVGIILFLFLLRKIKWSSKVGVPGVVEPAKATVINHGSETE